MNDEQKLLWWNYIVGMWYLSGAKIPSRTKLNQSWGRLKGDESFWFQTVLRHSGSVPLLPHQMNVETSEHCIGNFQGIILDDLGINNRNRKKQKGMSNE